MNFRHDDGDSNSSGNWPADLTEDEAMQIWLRVDRKQEDGRLLREQQMLRHEQDRSRHEGESRPPPGELAEHRWRGSISGSDGWPLGTPAACGQSALLTRQDDYIAAYQRFIKTDGPGMAGTHVARAQGPARPLERKREEDRRRIQGEHQRGQEDLAEELAACLRIEEQQCSAFKEAQRRRIQVEQKYYKSSQSSNDPTPQGPTYGLQDAAFGAQLREYERLSRAHDRAKDNHHQHDYYHPPAFTADMANGGGSSTKSKNSKKKKGQDQTITNYYVAVPNPTGCIIKSVYCYHCNSRMYTNPAAQLFTCHNCGHLSNVEEDAGRV